MPKVYIVQQPTRCDVHSGQVVRTIDLTPAEEFGELCFLLPERLPKQPLAKSAQMVKHALRNYKSEDFLILVGYPAFIGVATYYAAKKTNGRINVLRWNRNENNYKIMRFDLDAA